MKMEISEWLSISFLWVFNILIITSDGSHSHFSNYDEEPIPFSLRLTEESCSFPSRWEGNWFQSGVHLTITINRTGISGKGRCVEADGDKFIVYNPLDSCYRCVVFHEKHLNVLQYKETFCNSDPDGLSLQLICRTIPGDAHLYSMFRLDADPIPCPFQGPFSVSYSRGQGVCQYPISSIDTCIQSSRLVLNYQACHDVPGTESTVEELECLASWKEGSSRYMVGLLQYAHPSSFEDRFRCFVYEKGNKFGSPGSDGGSGLARGNHSTSDMDRVIFRVAQSGDATCLGLTPYEGSKTLTLHRGTSISKPCQFPAWLQAHAQWFTLNGKMSYSFEPTSLRIMDTSSDDSASSLLTTAACVQLKESEAEKVTIILRSTTQCQIGYVCLVVHRRDGHVIELQLGKLARDAENACHYSYFDETQSNFITLTSPTPETRQCPYEGQFDITSLSTGQSFHAAKCDASPNKLLSSLLMGCASLDSVHLNTQCSPVQRISEEYTCNAWWEEAGDNYLVATSVSSGNPRFCFTIREIILELSPQELRRKELSVRDSYESSSEEENREINFRKIFQFFLSSETCSRKVVHGGSEADLRFNASNYDNCNGVNSGQNLLFSSTYQVTVLTVLVTSAVISCSHQLLI